MRLSLLEWILGAAAAVLLVVVGLQAWKITRLTAKQSTMARDLANFAEANEANVQAIADFKRANEAWARRCKADASATSAALTLLDAERARQAESDRRSEADREVFYAQDPHARRWADAGMPAGLADRLWPQARPR